LFSGIDVSESGAQQLQATAGRAGGRSSGKESKSNVKQWQDVDEQSQAGMFKVSFIAA